ncbi:hypothetical protein [Ramlibacter sp.]|uniref:hypothetical protein n=1 Tax=Ramlibacter sp. TaxID=1917967 RepID=UPI0026080749|nr:hypothetical protein [Ramlibacter sp.]MDB5955854.1 hypothetical protein [Ramlibacter sp.]
MNRIRNTVVLGLLAGLAGVAGAQAKTRAQVEQEYFQAVQSGDVIGASGYTQRELRPDLYRQPQGSGIVRAQVQQQDASRNGDMLAPGRIGSPENQVDASPRGTAHSAGGNLQ